MRTGPQSHHKTPDNWTRLGVYSYPAPQCKITPCNYSVDLRSALWHFVAQRIIVLEVIVVELHCRW